MTTFWTPPVWSKGPDRLVAEAKVQLFQDRHDIEDGVLGADRIAMAGQVTAPFNEQERLIDSLSPGKNLAGTWLADLRDLHNTAPLEGRSGEGRVDEQGVANPNA